MISDCRIYTPDGQLKEVIPGEVLSERFWASEGKAPEPERRVTARRNGAAKSRNRRASEKTLNMVQRMVDFMRSNKPPKGHKGWTVSAILYGIGMNPSHNEYKQASVMLQNAHKPGYGGHPVRRKSRRGHLKRYEYFLDGGGE